MRLALKAAVTLLLAAALSACGGSDMEGLLTAEASLCSEGTLGAAINSTGPVPAGCVRIEGSKIGVAPQTLNAGGVTVRITSWTAKSGSAGEWVGFSFTQTGGTVAYAVKASTRTFASKDTAWLHPNGTSGSSANGISNITFCKDSGGGGGGTTTPGGGGTGTTPGATDGGGGTTTPGGGGTGTPGTDGGFFDEGIPGGGTGTTPGADGGIFDEGIPGGGSGTGSPDAGIFDEGIPSGSTPRDGGSAPGSGEECTPGGGTGTTTPGGPNAGSPGSPCVTSSSCASGLVCEAGVCASIIE